MRRFLCVYIYLTSILTVVWAQKTQYSLEGKIADVVTGEPVAGATIVIGDMELWAVSDNEGNFIIPSVDKPVITMMVSSLGYVKEKLTVKLAKGHNRISIGLKENNLSIDEIVVTAQKRSETQSTSYVLDRNVLDHSQMVNISQIGTLLPGGKTVGDQNLASNSNRIALHAGSASEMGNASFGTAIDIDGMRLENNANFSETKGADLRNVGVSNIESIEVVTGIPSVEHGDLSNGIVKINTRKGKTPFMVEIMTEPKTKQIALSKGWVIGKKATLNLNLERTKSVSNLASPYTSYDRNNLNVTYSNTFRDKKNKPLKLLASLAGNIGGYNSEADPDEFQDTYTKTRDYTVRGNIKLDYLLDKSWITNLSLQASMSYSDKLTKNNSNKNSASTQPYIHSTETGYYVGQLYEENPSAEIILGPTGYWYLLSYTDAKPLTYSFKGKADWTKRWGEIYNRLMVGVEWNGSGNLGRGNYYDDMRYAPTWREYRYDRLPFMNNVALFAENKLSVPTGEHSSLHLTLGLRNDMTLISQSEYGTVSNLSPRINAKYSFFEGTKSDVVSNVSIYGGWGKSVKQPSFSILYPSPSYSDKLAFAPGTTADGTTFYAYYTQPTTSRYNPDLKWQYVHQYEIGAETTIWGTKISVSFFRNKTFNPYMSRTLYTPYTYKFTSQSDIETGCTIPLENRRYTIDRHTGIVTVIDRTGVQMPQALSYKEKNTFVSQSEYTNGSPLTRQGIDFVLDFPQIRSLRTQVRLDGNYYRYKGLNTTLVSSIGSASASMDGSPYKYIGHYTGTGSVSNGSIEKSANLNATIVTHIPKVRMIFSVRIESSLYSYKQNLSEYGDGLPRGYLLENAGDYAGISTNLYNKNSHVAVYPEYYSTWEDPNTLIPFGEKLLWAKQHDPELYQDLAKLVVKSNTNYYFNENRITAYWAANFNLTKEIGRFLTISLYARNFFYQMGKVKSSQTGLESSLFDSGYIPKFYYGLSVRLKIN